MPKRVLVVDDAEPVLRAFARLFARCGFHVDCARELEEAEALAAHTVYDIVITDLSLHGGDGREGLEILRFLRQQHPRLPVILLTGYASPQLREEALARGVAAFVEKTGPLAEIARLAHELSGGCES
jgi:CheY-like chemotaxis protein